MGSRRHCDLKRRTSWPSSSYESRISLDAAGVAFPADVRPWMANSSPPISRKCTSGSRNRRFIADRRCAADRARSDLPPQPHSLHILLQRLEIPRCSRSQLGARLARHLVEHPTPEPFAHGLELRLLLRVEQWRDLAVERDADPPQLLDLLQSTERGVLL